MTITIFWIMIFIIVCASPLIIMVTWAMITRPEEIVKNICEWIDDRKWQWKKWRNRKWM